MKWLIDDARNWWRFWSVRIQMVCAFLSGLMYFDLPSLLYAWNLMPHTVRVLLPNNLVQALGAVLFVLSMVSMLARVAPQAKLKEKKDGE